MPTAFVCHRDPMPSALRNSPQSLSAAGHEVWLDEWRIDIGDSIVGRMNEGLEGDAHLPVLYGRRGHVAVDEQGMAAALARQLDGHGVQVKPVRLTGGSPPAILADMKYADLVADWDKGVAELLRAIR